VVVVIKDKADRKTRVPFGPFIAVGAIISFCYSADILGWYFGFFDHI